MTFFGRSSSASSDSALVIRLPRRGASERTTSAKEHLFFFALISFMNAWLTGNFQPTRIFVAAFLIDFTIRVLINPQYAPSLVLGRLAVRNQVPEYVGATQKRFAWSVGLALATAMLFLVVINRVRRPRNGAADAGSAWVTAPAAARPHSRWQGWSRR